MSCQEKMRAEEKAAANLRLQIKKAQELYKVAERKCQQDWRLCEKYEKLMYKENKISQAQNRLRSAERERRGACSRSLSGGRKRR